MSKIFSISKHFQFYINKNIIFFSNFTKHREFSLNSDTKKNTLLLKKLELFWGSRWRVAYNSINLLHKFTAPMDDSSFFAIIKMIFSITLSVMKMLKASSLPHWRFAYSIINLSHKFTAPMDDPSFLSWLKWLCYNLKRHEDVKSILTSSLTLCVQINQFFTQIYRSYGRSFLFAMIKMTLL